MKGEVISEKTSDIYFPQRFFLGKIKFASPRLISLKIHESVVQTSFCQYLY